MKIYEGAKLTSPDSEVYAILGVEFPIEGATVVWSGSRLTISIPQYEMRQKVHADGEPVTEKGQPVLERALDGDGRPIRGRNGRLDLLTQVAAPTELKGGKVQFSGVSTMLADGMRVDEADVTVSFTIEEYAWTPADS